MSDEGPQTAGGLKAVAERHDVSLDAVRHLLRALEAGGGMMAQFDHPDLGGFGQWSSGGMIMIGQMFDANLKARVAGLCAELAQSLPAGGWAGASPGGWWPAELGRPAASGAQNGMRYAYFPDSRRLAVETDGQLALYDTGDHDIGGVSQAQGGGRTLRFSGRNGSVDLDGLRRVDGAPPESPAIEPRPFMPDPIRTPEPAAMAQAWQTTPAPRQDTAGREPAGGGDVLATLERLAELHRKGVLTEAEFSGKKAELLARL